MSHKTDPPPQEPDGTSSQHRDRFQKAIELFEQARGMDSDSRDAFVTEACGDDDALRGEVDALLRHDAQPARILQSTVLGDRAALLAKAVERVTPNAKSIPKSIGRYRIMRLIGEGGMGTVYEAEQEHPRRTVALKVLRSGLASPSMMRRFEYEAQVLGRLQHPGIAQIIEAGVANTGMGEQPFLVMELVGGPRLDEYVKATSPDLRNRLGLFLRICEAVQHAHQKGVIHRDLKPDNIVVTQPESSGNSSTSISRSTSARGSAVRPKVLDFGLAKLTDADVAVSTMATEAGRIQGTLPYMSPEQARGRPEDIDLRSDVYSLGVILFELVTGQLPYNVNRALLHEAVRVICEEPPRRPSTISRLLRGDLETIALKALEKDPALRYQSAAALCDDIERFLADQPILARRPSAGYQLRKMVARHKLPFAFAAALFVMVTGFGAWMSVLYTRADGHLRRALEAEEVAKAEADMAQQATGRALHAEKQAKAEAVTAEETTKFLVNMFRLADPSEARGETITVREILDRGAAQVQTDLAEQPLVQATLLRTIGTVYNNLGLYDRAGELLKSAADLNAELKAQESAPTAESLVALAGWHVDTGDLATAEQNYREALRIQRARHPEDNLETADILNALGGVLVQRGKSSEAETTLRQSLAIRRERLGDEADRNQDTAQTLTNLAVLMINQQRFREGEALAKESADILRLLFPQGHPDLASTIRTIGWAQENLLNLVEAEANYRESLAMSRKVFPPTHPNIANSLDGLGKVLVRRGEFAEAETLMREVLAIYREVLGDKNPRFVFAINNLAYLLFQTGKYPEAEVLFTEALELARRDDEPNPVEESMLLGNIGAVQMESGKLEEAAVSLRESMHLKRQHLGAQSGTLAMTLNNLATVLFRLESVEEAEQMSRDALAMRQSMFGEHPETGQSLHNLAEILRLSHRPDEALPLYQASATMLAKTQGEDHPFVGFPLVGLGEALTEMGAFSEAEALLLRAMTIREARLPAEHPDLTQTRAALGACLLGQGRIDEAKPLILAAFQYMVDGPPVDAVRRKAVLDRVKALYDALGRPEEAETLLTSAGLHSGS